MEKLRDDIAAASVAVGGISKSFGNEAAKKLISSAANAKVLACEYVPGYEHSGERYITRFESVETANGLVTTIKHAEITEDGELYQLKFEEVPPCEVPEDWLKQKVDEIQEEVIHDVQSQGQPEGQGQQKQEPSGPPLGQGQDKQWQGGSGQGQGQDQQWQGGPAQGQGHPRGPPPGQYQGVGYPFFPAGMGQPRFMSGPDGQRYPMPGAWPPYGMQPMRPPGPGTPGDGQRQQNPDMSQFPGFMYPPYSQGQGANKQFQPPMYGYVPNFGPVSGYYENVPGSGASPRGPPPPYNDDQKVNQTEVRSPGVKQEEKQTPEAGHVVEGFQKEIEEKLERKVQEEQMRQQQQQQQQPQTQETEDAGEAEAEEQTADKITKILVKNIHPSTSDEDIQNFFENRRRSGGGDVKAVRLDTENHYAIVEFMKEDAVQRVLQKCPIVLMSKKLDIEEYTSPVPSEEEESEEEDFEDAPPPPSKTVKVEGLSRTTSKDTLELYFENTKRSGGEGVEKIVLEEEEGIAYITFEEVEVAKTVAGKEHMLDKCQLDVSIYEPPRSAKRLSSVEEQEAQCTIEVHDVPENTGEETVTMYFENTRRSGGDEIKNVEFRDGVYYITFFSEEVAKRVVENKNLMLSKVPLRVVLYEPEEEPELCSIEVRGFSTTSKETLEMYFENTKRSGGDNITNIEQIADELMLISFESEEVARRVVEKTHVIEKHSLEVELHVPAKEKKGGSSGQAEATQQSEAVPQNLCTIEVQGISPKTSRSTLEMYFENTRRSGGADIETYDFIQEKGMAYVTFESETVAKAVAEREHTVEGAKLTVKVYIPPPPVPMYKNKILITGKNPKTTQDCLCNFLEAKSGGLPTGFLYGEDEGTVLVTFEEPPDVSKLQAACSKRALENHKLKITKVPVSTCIIVSNLNPATTADTLWFYFENQKRSGGGAVKDVVMNAEEGFCLVHFERCETADTVLQKKHKVDNHDLIVHLYLECLGRSQGDGSEPAFKPPPPLKLKNINWHVVQFLKSSETNKGAVDAQLSGCYASVKWPESQQDPVILECTLTTDVKGHRKLASTWAKKAEMDFNDYVKLIESFDLTVLQDSWDKVMGELQSIEIANPDAVAVFIEPKERIIRIVGHKMPANDLRTDVEGRIKKVEAELERLKQQIKETKTSCKGYQLQLLLALKYPSKMEDKYKGLKVRIKAEKNEIMWEGLTNEVRSAQVEMYEYLTSASSHPLKKVSDGCLELYKRREVKAYIVRKLKAKSLTGVWEVSGSDLIIHATSDEEVAASAHLIRDCVIESPIVLKAEAKSVLTSDKWQTKVSELEKNNQGLVKIVASNDLAKLFIYSTDDVAPNILECVNDFLRYNTIQEETFKVTPGIMKYIERYNKAQITQIVKDLEQFFVNVSYVQNSFVIKGTEDGVNSARYRLQEIVRKVKTRDHQIQKPGVGHYMQSPKGQDGLKVIESQTLSVIEVKSDSDESGGEMYGAGENTGDMDDFEFVKVDSNGMTTHAVSKAYDDRKVYAVEGDMTNLTVDVMVNAADKNLNHAGGLAKAIVQKGGQVIQDECTAYVAKEGPLMEGEIFTTTAGQLKCQMVIHAVGPVYQGGHRNEEDLLRETVFKSMEQASVKNLKSIAIPALSSGVYGYPVRQSTKIIAGSIKDFFREMQESTLREVYMCDVKSQTVRCFAEALQTVFGESNTTKSEIKSRPKPSHDDWSEPPSSKGKRRSQFAEPAPSMPDYGSSRSRGFGKITVKMVKGEMAKEKVDVIVNTTSKSLDLKNGAVSASLLATGGPKLQQECTQKYPNGVQDREVAITGPANLGCQMVLHGSLISWDGGASCKPSLHGFMSKCLAEAEKNGYKSISFPALGTGNLGYPKDFVAKEMYQHISDYANKKPKSPITEVHFVVYHKDSPTIKAFDLEQQKWTTTGREGSRTMRHSAAYSMTTEPGHDDSSGEDFGEDEEDGAGGGGRYKGIFSSSQGDSTAFIGSVKVKIYQGDITAEDSDCIVNSSNNDLDLSRGAVSRALLSKGGKRLQSECDRQVKAAKRDGVAVTKAYGLNCQHIMHVIAMQTKKEWRDAIEMCLMKAEEFNMKSLSFPALGTGLKTKPEDIADVMFSTLSNFQSQNPNTSLSEVRVVIFQAPMVSTFTKVAGRYVDSSGAKPKQKSFLQKVWHGMTAIAGLKQEDSDSVTTAPDQQNSHSMMSRPEAAATPPQTIMSDNEVTLTIITDTEERIRHAIKLLVDGVNREWQEKDFNESIIKKFTKQQIDEIRELAGKHKIDVQLKEKSGKLRIQGRTEGVMNATDRIHAIIRSAEKSEQQKNEAEMMSKMVQWFFIEVTSEGTNLEKYDPSMNLMIEKAYQEQKPNVKFFDNDKVEYTLDFKNMEEFPSDNPADTVKVIRRDTIKDASFEPPATWSVMQDSENLKVVTLQPTDQEYTDVTKSFLSTCGGQKTVSKVDRVQNRTLFQQYMAKKKQLDTKYGNDQNEKLLWHGTAADTVDSINTHGFNRSYCGKNATYYGDGVYFAQNANYSCSDTYSRPDANGNKRIYLCRVLTGQYTRGAQGMRVPPKKQSGSDPTDLYECVVDNANSPGIYVIFHDTQAYPEYLITFK